MDWNSIVSGLISGLMTGTLTCWVFYWLAGKDLKREASDLRKLNILTIRALEQVGLAEVHMDAQGNPVGLKYNLDPAETLTLTGSVTNIKNADLDAAGTLKLSGSVTNVKNPDKPPDEGSSSPIPPRDQGAGTPSPPAP